MFDSRPAVVLSALETLAKIRDPGSFPIVSRLFTHNDEEIRRAAVAAAGELKHPDAGRVLLDLYNVTQDDRLRCTILDSLWKVARDDERVRLLVEECARSALVSPAVRASAAAALMAAGRSTGPYDVLTEAQGEYIDAVYAEAEADAELARAVLKHGLAAYLELSGANRRLLVTAAGAHALAGASGILGRALRDADPEVRLAAYRAVGRDGDGASCEATARLLWEGAEDDPAVEGEAWSAIERIEERLKERSASLTFELKGGVSANIRALFEELAASDRENAPPAAVSAAARSREFLEFYADETLKRAVVEHLKGSGFCSVRELLTMVKNAATRLEICHLEGYRALIDIIGNPERHVLGLVIRELAQARLGKRRLMHRLVRCLRLSRLYGPAGGSGEEAACYLRIHEWSRTAGLYRLAEAALSALIVVDPKKAMEIAARCLMPPVPVKMLAIASIRMLKELDWRLMEPVIVRLLGATEDSHVLLNIMDALGTLDLPLADSTVKLLLSRLASSTVLEVAARIADVIASKADFAVFDSIRLLFDQSEEWKQRLCLTVVGRMILRDIVRNRDGVVEFLYRVLRTGSQDLKSRAACLLWRLGDEYSVEVIRDLISHGTIDTQEQVLQGLQGAVGPAIVPVLFPLLGTEVAKVQNSLRSALLSAESDEARQALVGLLLAGAEAEAEGGVAGEQAEVKLDLLRERSSYRFDREHVQALAIFFTDIQGYSSKVEHLSGMELAVFIQEYEGVLLPVVGSHRGELIKKMGDGHLFVFESPLDAALAAVRLQKALTRFNSYREERLRVNVRIGIHYGEVVRREGDVLGNDVNIAARLQGAARAGSALVSAVFQERVKDYIHSKGIGYVNIKGISEPVDAFEPYEIAVDLPQELDPLRGGRAKAAPARPAAAPAPRPAPAPAAAPAAVRAAISPELLAYLQKTFANLYSSCRKAELGQIEVTQLRKQILEGWQGLKKRVTPPKAESR